MKFRDGHVYVLIRELIFILPPVRLNFTLLNPVFYLSIPTITHKYKHVRADGKRGLHLEDDRVVLGAFHGVSAVVEHLPNLPPVPLLVGGGVVIVWDGILQLHLLGRVPMTPINEPLRHIATLELHTGQVGQISGNPELPA